MLTARVTGGVYPERLNVATPLAWSSPPAAARVDVIGRTLGHAAIARFGARIGLTEARFGWIEGLFARYGAWTVMFARFFNVLRQLNGIVAGTLGMGWWRFLVCNAVGAAIANAHTEDEGGNMLAIVGWSIAALLGSLLLIVQWSWRKHAVESLAQSEFIAIMFMDPIVYENNRRVYTDWLEKLPDHIDVGHVLAASQGAKNTATSYMGKLGVTSGLFAVLANYKSSRAP
jgi:SNARE associated Golgi protein